MTGLVMGGLAVLVVAGWIVVRLRMRSLRGEDRVELTEEMIRRIEDEGRVETDQPEPLDYDEIREEEDRFWSETWDEPDEPIL